MRSAGPRACKGAQAIGVVATVLMEPGIGHVSGMRTGGGDLITTDGRVALIVLK